MEGITVQRSLVQPRDVPDPQHGGLEQKDGQRRGGRAPRGDRPCVRDRPARPPRAVPAGSAHSHTSSGWPNVSSGAATSISSVCWVMCAENRIRETQASGETSARDQRDPAGGEAQCRPVRDPAPDARLAPQACQTDRVQHAEIAAATRPAPQTPSASRRAWPQHHDGDLGRQDDEREPRAQRQTAHRHRSRAGDARILRSGLVRRARPPGAPRGHRAEPDDDQGDGRRDDAASTCCRTSQDTYDRT